MLFAYKLNWQSVLFLGYGEDRAIDADGGLDRTGRQFFLKVSYAFRDRAHLAAGGPSARGASSSEASNREGQDAGDDAERRDGTL